MRRTIIFGTLSFGFAALAQADGPVASRNAGQFSSRARLASSRSARPGNDALRERHDVSTDKQREVHDGRDKDEQHRRSSLTGHAGQAGPFAQSRSRRQPAGPTLPAPTLSGPQALLTGRASTRAAVPARSRQNSVRRPRND